MRRPSRKHVGCFVALGMGALFLGVFLTAVWKSRQAVVRTMCYSNAKHIGVSVLNYLDRSKTFPPGTVPSALPVEQRFSWLTPILVGWSRHDVTKADPTRPWDHEANRGVSNDVVNWYRCNFPREDPRPLTTYAGVTGLGADSPLLPESPRSLETDPLEDTGGSGRTRRCSPSRTPARASSGTTAGRGRSRFGADSVRPSCSWSTAASSCRGRRAARER